jgi:hypothetical protein
VWSDSILWRVLKFLSKERICLLCDFVFDFSKWLFHWHYSDTTNFMHSVLACVFEFFNFVWSDSILWWVLKFVSKERTYLLCDFVFDFSKWLFFYCHYSDTTNFMYSFFSLCFWVVIIFCRLCCHSFITLSQTKSFVKRLLGPSRQSVRFPSISMSTWNNLVPTGQILMKA